MNSGVGGVRMVVTGKMSVSCYAVASCDTATGDGRPPGGRALGFGGKMAERGGFSTLPVRPSASQVRIPDTFRQEKNGGERGIRTPDRGLAYTRFPSVRLQPLGHLSARVPHKFLPRTSRCGLGRSHLYALGGEINVAEGKGFEPPIPFQVLQFSRLAPSTTRPPFRLLRS